MIEIGRAFDGFDAVSIRHGTVPLECLDGFVGAAG